MHELSICLALLDQVTGIARERQATRVERILLRIGPLSGIEPALLANAFPLAAAGTLAETAVLEVAAGPIRVQCLDCGSDTEASANRLLCGACGGHRTRLLSGDELLLARLELALPEDSGEAVAPDARDG